MRQNIIYLHGRDISKIPYNDLVQLKERIKLKDVKSFRDYANVEMIDDEIVSRNSLELV